MGEEKIEIGPVHKCAIHPEPNANLHHLVETVNVTNYGIKHCAPIANATTIVEMIVGVIVKLKLKRMLDAGGTTVNEKND